MTDVEAARKAWIAERKKFAKFGDLIAKRLRMSLRQAGIIADVTARAKEIDSLVKKLLLYPTETYKTLPDKVGVRVVFKYRADTDAVIKIVSEMFDHDAPDDKADDRGITEVGYLSVHLDRARLKSGDEDVVEFPPSEFFAEVQLRTQAQHLWAEMSHDDVYKNDETANELSRDLKRRIHLMAGQIEVADRELDRINQEIGRGNDAYKILRALERNYFKLTTHRPNVELSMAVIRLLIPIFHGKSDSEIISMIDSTYEDNSSMFEEVYQDPDKAVNPGAFFFQPEALLIYNRLINDRDEVMTTWNTRFPQSELERVASNFGISFD